MAEFAYQQGVSAVVVAPPEKNSVNNNVVKRTMRCGLKWILISVSLWVQVIAQTAASGEITLVWLRKCFDA